MDDSRDTGILALLVVIAVCLAVFYLKTGQPTGAIVDFLFPRL